MYRIVTLSMHATYVMSIVCLCDCNIVHHNKYDVCEPYPYCQHDAIRSIVECGAIPSWSSLPYEQGQLWSLACRYFYKVIVLIMNHYFPLFVSCRRILFLHVGQFPWCVCLGPSTDSKFFRSSLSPSDPQVNVLNIGMSWVPLLYILISRLFHTRPNQEFYCPHERPCHCEGLKTRSLVINPKLGALEIQGMVWA